jgi:transglycosylase-like protein with SLT domain
MKSLLDWQFTMTFRPVRFLMRMCIISLVLVACMTPPRLGTGVAASTVSSRAPTPAQVSRATAVKAVDQVVSSRMSYLDRDRRQQLVATIVDESLACGFDPLFILALGDVESKMDHEAVSPTGARGLYQVMPSTWAGEVKRRGLGRLEKFNVVHNAKVGIGYLCHLSTTFKRPDSVLLAYNQGPGGATAILSKRLAPSEEAATYAAKVWQSYKGILGEFGLPNDAKSMRQLYKAPERTVYASAVGGVPPMKTPSVPVPAKAKAQAPAAALVVLVPADAPAWSPP